MLCPSHPKQYPNHFAYNSAVSLKVVIENPTLRGSPQDQMIQRVATVYVDGAEYRVYAPPKATGDALEWSEHFSVRRADNDPHRSEIMVADQLAASVVRQVIEELKQMRLDEDIWDWGRHPDARFYAAHICLRGHVLCTDGIRNVRKGERCEQCGAVCIRACGL
jgi:hypothetical protein